MLFRRLQSHLCWLCLSQATGSALLYHTAVLQIVEIELAVFPLSFCHPFPVINSFDSHEKELAFLDVSLRMRCPEIRSGMTSTQDDAPALFVQDTSYMHMHHKIALISFVEPETLLS